MAQKTDNLKLMKIFNWGHQRTPSLVKGHITLKNHPLIHDPFNVQTGLQILM